MPTRLFFWDNNASVWERVFQAFVLTSVESFLALVCLLAGVPVLINPAVFAPAAMKAMSAWLVYPWAVGMLIGGATTLVGIGKEDLRIERMGISILGAVAFIFLIALLTAGGPVSIIGILNYAFFTLSMVARYWVLGQMLKHANELKQRIYTRLRKAAPDVD